MSNLTIIESNPFNINEMINHVILHRLYIEGFELYNVLMDALQFGNDSLKVNMLLVDNIPCGVVLYTSYSTFSVQIFIKEEERHKGYGKVLLQSLLNRLDEKEKMSIHVGIGTDESFSFWGSMVEKNILKEKSVSFYEIIKLRRQAEKRQAEFLASNNLYSPLHCFMEDDENNA